MDGRKMFTRFAGSFLQVSIALMIPASIFFVIHFSVIAFFAKIQL
jgi:hypothetical protein